MVPKIRQSLKNINYRLYAALLVFGLVPTIYTSVRVFFLGQLPGEWAFSIAGQLSWVNLFYEVLQEAIILPLFHFIGDVNGNKNEFSNRVRTGMIISLGMYAALSMLVFIFAKPLLQLMAADDSIIGASASYIRIESIANVFGILTQFVLVTLVMIGKSQYLYALTGAKLVLCLVCDTFLVSELPMSMNLGVKGIGYSNIIVNVLLLVVSLVLLNKEQICVFSGAKLRFSWMKEYIRSGGISGLESLVRNVAYMVMIARMVNMVGEQGTYWVANNFIWGWLLLPVLQLGELIKREVADDRENIRRNSIGYFTITGIIVILWFVSMPAWGMFMEMVLGIAEPHKILSLARLLVVFYVFYAIQNVFDATFYGRGKTEYMLFESVVTNSIYYGIAFVLYATGVWVPTLTGIAWMFGLGNVFDSVVSLGAYVVFLKREKIVYR